MSETDVIAGTRQFSSGAHFLKCALQVNPQHYASTFRGQEVDGDPETHAVAIVEKAAQIGVSVLAITDHNSVSGISAFRQAASNHCITIFPGFELSSSEGIHVLCLYPPDTDEARLERFLGEFGIRETAPSSDLANKNFAEVLQGVREQGGVTIAAHVTNDNGLFKVLSGESRIRAWHSDDLLAIQIPGPVQDLDQSVRSIIMNKNPEYRRSRAAGEELAVAVVNAKDIVRPDDLDGASGTCWVKMSQISIEGLRQAFLDPDSRIRLSSGPEPEEHTELVELAWEGGFLDGAAFRFTPNLNVLVGGRGTGKSTVIESLRYVLDLDPVGEDALKTHQSIVRQVLRSGTKISLLAHSYRPVKQEYQIERTVPNPPVIRDESGQISNLHPKEILPHVEVYGQHEISELVKRREKLTRLLDRFVEDDESLHRRKWSLRRDLEQTRRSILDVRSELQQIGERLSALPALEETLMRFQEAGLEDRLREQSLLVREERVLASIPERLQTFRECLELLRPELPIDRVFLSPRALAELPGKDILAGANGVLERLSYDLDQVTRQLDTALKVADEGIDEIRSRWDERKREVEATYQQILRDLQQSAVDGDEFIRLRREIESLRPLCQRQTLLERLEKEHADRRRALLAEWEEVKAQEFRLRDRAAKKVSRKLRDRVQVKVTAAGDREPLFRVLRDEIGGRLSEAIDRLKQAPDLSLPQFVECCRTGVEEVRRTYAIPSGQAARLAHASPEVLMQIEELELPPTMVMRLNTAAAGAQPSWQALDALSTGQKATAVLLLLLLESEAPLIVDQPEDDLDNRFITEGVVPRMREEKQRRQFVFSTHNANIPVLGDAELILGLAASGEAEDGKAVIAPEHMGSIDAQPVRELVEEILEGGKAAFETRRLKYGF